MLPVEMLFAQLTKILVVTFVKYSDALGIKSFELVQNDVKIRPK